MMTPIGDCAAQTATSARAGICRFQQSSVHNKRFRPMTLALLPDDALPPLAGEAEAAAGLTARQRRMLRLAGPALREAIATAGGAGDAVAGLPLMQDRAGNGSGARAFVCRGYVCDQPTSSADELRRQLRVAAPRR